LQFELQIISRPVSGEKIGCDALLHQPVIVNNGEQSVVQDLILGFSTCKIASATQADVNLY
jgi:hypothetical protein